MSCFCIVSYEGVTGGRILGEYVIAHCTAEYIHDTPVRHANIYQVNVHVRKCSCHIETLVTYTK